MQYSSEILEKEQIFILSFAGFSLKARSTSRFCLWGIEEERSSSPAALLQRTNTRYENWSPPGPISPPVRDFFQA